MLIITLLINLISILLIKLIIIPLISLISGLWNGDIVYISTETFKSGTRNKRESFYGTISNRDYTLYITKPSVKRNANSNHFHTLSMTKKHWGMLACTAAFFYPFLLTALIFPSG